MLHNDNLVRTSSICRLISSEDGISPSFANLGRGMPTLTSLREGNNCEENISPISGTETYEENVRDRMVSYPSLCLLTMLKGFQELQSERDEDTSATALECSRNLVMWDSSI